MRKIGIFIATIFSFAIIGLSVTQAVPIDVGNCQRIMNEDHPPNTRAFECTAGDRPYCGAEHQLAEGTLCAAMAQSESCPAVLGVDDDNIPSGEEYIVCIPPQTATSPRLYCCHTEAFDVAPPPTPPPGGGNGGVFSCSTSNKTEELNTYFQTRLDNGRSQTQALDSAIDRYGCETPNALCSEDLVTCEAFGTRYCCPVDPIKSGPSFVGCVNEPDEDKNACEDCVGSVNSPTGKIWTEIGCLDPSPAGIITRMFQIAFGILGGVGILRLMQIGVLYQSQDQEKIKEAKDMVFSLFAGIILMIMGIVILRFLGVNVLGLPDNFLGV